MFHVEHCTYNDRTANEKAEGITPFRVFFLHTAFAKPD